MRKYSGPSSTMRSRTHTSAPGSAVQQRQLLLDLPRRVAPVRRCRRLPALRRRSATCRVISTSRNRRRPRAGLARGFSVPRHTQRTRPARSQTFIVDDPEKSSFYKPLNEFSFERCLRRNDGAARGGEGSDPAIGDAGLSQAARPSSATTISRMHERRSRSGPCPTGTLSTGRRCAGVYDHRHDAPSKFTSSG